MRFAVFVMCWIVPAAAAAQPAARATFRHDVSLNTGWAGSEYEFSGADRWRGAFLLGMKAGRHWNDHLKTEVEAGWLPTTSAETYEDANQGPAAFALVRVRASDLRIGVGQIYQFRRNQWVHPYVGAGADFVATRVERRREEQARTVYVGSHLVRVTIPPDASHRTEHHVQPFVRTGLKMYATDRAFFHTDLKVAFTGDVDHAVWSAGFGVDF